MNEFEGRLQPIIEHQEWVRSLVRRLVLDQSVVDDVVQEAWLQILKSEELPTRSVRGWLAVTVRRLVWRRMRADSRRDRVESTASRSYDASAASSADRHLDDYREISDAVKNLATDYRTVVIMRYYDGLEPKVIAEKLGLPATTVRNRLSRACDQLRDHLDRRHGSRRDWMLSLLPLIRPTAGEIARAQKLAMLACAPTVAALIFGALLLVRPNADETRLEGGVITPTPREETAKAPSLPITAPEAEADRLPADRPETFARSFKGRVAGRLGDGIADIDVALYEVKKVDQSLLSGKAGDERYRPIPALATAVTNEKGEFVLPIFEGRKVRIEARKKGLGRSVVGPFDGANPPSDPIALVLYPSAVASCLVVDETGRPIPDVEIGVRTGEIEPSVVDWPSAVVERSAADGTFSVDLLTPDEAGDPRQALRLAGGPSNAVPVIYLRKPGYLETLNATLLAGRVNLTGQSVFVLKRGRRLEFSFRSRDGMPAAALPFVVGIVGHGTFISATTDADGRAVIEDAPKYPSITVSLRSHEWSLVRPSSPKSPPFERVEQTFEIKKEGPQYFEIMVQHGGEASGRVVDRASGRPVPAIEIVAYPEIPKIDLSNHVTRSITDADGRFRLTNLPPGPMTIRVHSKDLHAAEASPVLEEFDEDDDGDDVATKAGNGFTIRGRRPLVMALVADQDRPISDLLVAVEKNAVVSGRIVDAESNGVAGAKIAVEFEQREIVGWPSLLRKESTPETESSDDGRFTLAGVPPAAVRRLVVRRPEMPKVYFTVGRVVAGQTIDVGTIASVLARRLEILVVDERGVPVKDIGVRVFDGGRYDWVLGPDDVLGKTAEDGVFATRLVAFGTIRIVAESPRDRELTPLEGHGRVVVWSADSADNFKIVLGHWRKIRGRVRYPGGDPAAYIELRFAVGAMSSPDEVVPTPDERSETLIEYRRGFENSAIVVTDASGSFELAVIGETEWTLDVARSIPPDRPSLTKEHACIRGSRVRPDGRFYEFEIER